MGRLIVTVVCCNKLMDCDTFTKSDPYVVLTLDGKKQKTRVMKGNLDPKFNEAFTYFVDPAAMTKIVGSGVEAEPAASAVMNISVMDSDYFSDDIIGTAKVSLLGLVAGEAQESTIRLTPENGGSKFVGEICLKVLATDFSTPTKEELMLATSSARIVSNPASSANLVQNQSSASFTSNSQYPPQQQQSNGSFASNSQYPPPQAVAYPPNQQYPPRPSQAHRPAYPAPPTGGGGGGAPQYQYPETRMYNAAAPQQVYGSYMPHPAPANGTPHGYPPQQQQRPPQHGAPPFQPNQNYLYRPNVPQYAYPTANPSPATGVPPQTFYGY